ncbi:TPA: helix-turn-helix transcriptional regulator [Streptococcus pyogenes]|nr:helix-turn-helix transcriptional regulator [Streptococcus pyogenes]
MTPEQCRAGRALVGMTQKELAKRAGINRRAVLWYERGRRMPLLNNLRVMRAVLEADGVEMIDGERPGVRFSAERTR